MTMAALLAGRGPVRPAWWWAGMLLAALMTLLWPRHGHAESVELTTFNVVRSDEGVLLSFTASFELPHSVEDALVRGVPLYFEAEATLLQSRWYWRDKRVTRATRNWRLTWQPLTRHYRINLGSVSQNYDTLPDALGSIQRATRWKLADASVLEDETRQYVEFSLRLDTSQLPRPLQIGFGGQAAWDLALERTAVVPEPVAR
ncbi:DUF4390 domain-containing protein [Methylibium sp.]|uniref:DUF4390 domain-containing protein n=1 Tax=Methylibium sp. TaxID=2067992 RepID=UPI00286C9913|nr:DUF4390 domain-containing protein [Methylibium sp.]